MVEAGAASPRYLQEELDLEPAFWPAWAKRNQTSPPPTGFGVGMDLADLSIGKPRVALLCCNVSHVSTGSMLDGWALGKPAARLRSE